jgi:hypothetical protein
MVPHRCDSLAGSRVVSAARAGQEGRSEGPASAQDAQGHVGGLDVNQLVDCPCASGGRGDRSRDLGPQEQECRGHFLVLASWIPRQWRAEPMDGSVRSHERLEHDPP